MTEQIVNKGIEIKQIDSSEVELVVVLFNQYRIFYNQPSDIQLARTFIDARIQNNESIIFVALFDDGNKKIPVGFTQLYPKYSSARAIKNWILNDLYVDSAYRKQGIGERLINSAIAFAKVGGAKFVQLETATDNKTAQSLYESIGFKKQDPDNEFFLYRIDVN